MHSQAVLTWLLLLVLPFALAGRVKKSPRYGNIQAELRNESLSNSKKVGVNEAASWECEGDITNLWKPPAAQSRWFRWSRKEEKTDRLDYARFLNECSAGAVQLDDHEVDAWRHIIIGDGEADGEVDSKVHSELEGRPCMGRRIMNLYSGSSGHVGHEPSVAPRSGGKKLEGTSEEVSMRVIIMSRRMDNKAPKATPDEDSHVTIQFTMLNHHVVTGEEIRLTFALGLNHPPDASTAFIGTGYFDKPFFRYGQVFRDMTTASSEYYVRYATPAVGIESKLLASFLIVVLRNRAWGYVPAGPANAVDGLGRFYSFDGGRADAGGYYSFQAAQIFMKQLGFELTAVKTASRIHSLAIATSKVRASSSE